jgi:hypothetical protein
MLCYTETSEKHMGEGRSMKKRWLTDGNATLVVDGVAPAVGIDLEGSNNMRSSPWR